MIPSLEDRLRAAVVDVPDWPKPGVTFKDLCPVYEDARLFRDIVSAAGAFAKDRHAQAVAAVEMRGMLVGSALAYSLGVPLVLLRKPGKLPRKTVRAEYALEYGTDALEMQKAAPVAERRVLVVDDLLATGGTASAARQLIEMGAGSCVGYFFIVELEFLRGRARLGDLPVRSLLSVR